MCLKRSRAQRRAAKHVDAACARLWDKLTVCLLLLGYGFYLASSGEAKSFRSAVALCSLSKTSTMDLTTSRRWEMSMPGDAIFSMRSASSSRRCLNKPPRAARLESESNYRTCA